MEEKSGVTLIWLTGFARNRTQIDMQIGLLRATEVTGMDTQVGGQTELLGIAGVTRTMTWVDE
jgi:hypothetical protein